MEQRVVGRYKRSMTSHVAQWVKNLPAMQESRVWSLCWEDPLEEGMATHSSILALRIPWTEEPGRLIVHRISKSWTWLKWLSKHAHAKEVLIEDIVSICKNVFSSLLPFTPMDLCTDNVCLQSKSTVDWRRCKAAGWNDHLYLQPSWECVKQSPSAWPGQGNPIELPIFELVEGSREATTLEIRAGPSSRNLMQDTKTR